MIIWAFLKFGTKGPMKSGPKSVSAGPSRFLHQSSVRFLDNSVRLPSAFFLSPVNFLFVSCGLAVGKRAVNVR